MCFSCVSGPDHPDADEIAIKFGVITNLTDGDYFEAEFVLRNNGPVPLRKEGWTLYFNLARAIVEESVPPSVMISHVNGDFYKLEPTENFGSLEPGEERAIPFRASNWIIKEAEAPAGLYFVFSDPSGQAEEPRPVNDYTIRPLVSSEQTSRNSLDRMAVPTAGSRFIENSLVSDLAKEEIPRIIPTPVSTRYRDGTASIGASTEIRYEAPLESEAQYLQESLETLLGFKLEMVADGRAAPYAILLRQGSLKIGRSMKRSGDEAYNLWISAKRGIEIVGTDPAGVLFGIQSLRALFPIESYRSPQSEVVLREVFIEDFPRFSYRGMHLDVARNFQSAEQVKKFLELMSFYKLNRFHFHITDDEGWRLEIEELPELTEIGSRRGHTTNERDRIVPSLGSGPEPDQLPGSGYYSRDEFIEILRAAKTRHIQVIPEIDLPGHARAAIKAMEVRMSRDSGSPDFLLSDPGDQSEYRSVQGWTDNVINVCRDSTYRFLETVVDDIIEIYQEAEAPLTTIHTGGDEVPHGVWSNSPVCREFMDEERIRDARGLISHFLARMSAILSERELILAGWEEIALTNTSDHTSKEPNLEFVEDGFQAYAWNSVWGWGGEQNAYKLANAGYPVVLSNVTNLYFDLSYSKHPAETGYYWGGFVDTRKAWEFTPLNIYLGVKEDLFGQPIDPASLENAVSLTIEGKDKILGLQGQLWSENMTSPELMEYLAFPKLLGLAERAWSPQPEWAEISETEARKTAQNDEWNYFANSLGHRELARLDSLAGGVHYRIPPPGAELAEGVLRANIAYPGLEIRFSTDGSEPSMESPLYEGPVEVEANEVKLKAFSDRGRQSRTAVVTAE